MEYTYVQKYIIWIKHSHGERAASLDLIKNFQRNVNGMHGGN
jgi:hypothetical protein